MTKTRSTKRALLMSVLSMFLCVVMLAGTTFAWFTDTVTSTNNIIKSGNLNVEMYYADGKLAVPADDSTDWKNANGVAIYTADQLWEPGYTDAKHIKISNEGNLALKYQLAIIPTGVVSDLAEVIDVYLYEIADTDANATQVATRADLNEAMKVGTLKDVISQGIVQGNLNAQADYTTTIVLKMQESAGNDYKDKSIGDSFTIQLLATQLADESDSFDNTYDADAWVDGMQVYNASDLQAAINAGETNIKLMDDITLTESIVIPASATTFSMRSATPATVIDLNGKTITGNVGRDADGNRVHVIVNNGNAVIKNGVITSAGVNGGSAIYNADGATLTVESVTLNGAPQEGSTWPSYTVNNYGTLTVSDSSIYGVQGIIATNNTANTTVNNVIAYRDGWSSGHVFYTSSTAKVTINGGTYTNDGNGVDGTMIYGGETVVNGGTFIVKEGAYFALCSGSKLTVNGGDFSNIKSCIAWGGAMTISGGTFGFNPTTYVADGYHALQVGDKYQVVPESVDAIVSDNAELVAALQDTTTDEIILAAGEFTADIYNITARDTLLITGQGADTKLAFSNLQVRPSQFKNLTIENCTIERMPNKNWGHMVYASSDNASGVYTISNCIFNGVGSQGIFINENVSGATYNIVDCVFNGDFGREGAITIQNNADVNVNVNVNGCTFNNIPETSNEIFVHYENKGLNLTVDGKVTVANATMLADAVSKGATHIWLADGNYTMPQDSVFQGKTLTISGTKDAVIDISAIPTNGSQAFTGATLVFDGVTLNCATVNYKGFTHAASLTYKNCQINGLQFLFAENVTFENCDLNSNGAEHCVWTWSGDRTISFTGCDFTYDDRAVNCYGENGTTNVSFTDCTFTKVEGKETTGAIETNSAALTALNLTINNCSVNEGKLWFVADPWDSLKGANTSVTVDGKVTVATAEQLRALAATATGDVELVLASNITLGNDTDVCYAVNFENATSVTIDGNGNSIIFKGKAAHKSDTGLDMVAGIISAGEITIKNVTLVNDKLSYYGKETSGDRIQVYTTISGTSVAYENVTFDGGVRVKTNETFKNCNFTETLLEADADGYANNGRFCMFIDHEWETTGTYTVTMEGCTFNASGYGCVKVAGNKGATITVNVKDCTFNNTCPSNSWDKTTPKYDVKMTGNNITVKDLGGNTWVKGYGIG